MECLGHILTATVRGMLLWYVPSHFFCRARKDSGLSVRLNTPPFGVGHWPWVFGPRDDEDPIPAVRGTDGGSRYAIPDCIIPARGQVFSEYSTHPPTKQRCDVLYDDESGT